MRKKIDSRIRTLVENCVKTRHRSLFVIVGDKGRDQVVNLHYMLSKAVVKARPSVLWCYKKDVYMSSHKKKRMKQIQKMALRGLLDAEKEDPFSLFVASTNIRYCYYNDTQSVLGNTYGMCVLQDFEGISPNLLARTVETVEGGGVVVMLISTLRSLTQLYSLTMDVHSRLKTESHAEVRGRFTERLVLSLAGCQSCILMDDEMNILPTSSHVRGIQPVPLDADGTPVDLPGRANRTELKELTENLVDTQPAGTLTAACKTLDQARAVITFLDAASEKTLRSTVALTAARGRGKSAALGLSIAGAVAIGYSNIFVTAPSPENLRTLFEFVFKGLDALGYKEHMDYDLVESTNPAFGKAVVRANVYRTHRQTIQYIQPHHHARLGQAELLVIDEAAAIPLPIVRQMLGPYLVFLCSTVNGYEGTGRSLSLKLISQLREQSVKGTGANSGAADASATGRTFREVSLNEPIRYGEGDLIERWLNELLCLNAADHTPRLPPVLPHPDECELFYVERDTLFSGHRVSELALQRMMSLYVASHYKNTPNDLLLLSDAPAHHLFVLTAPVIDKSKNCFPDILCVIQVALEGAISRSSAVAALAAGQLPQGDLLPWMVGQQFQDSQFPSLSGARIVRIATHPGLLKAGYGTRAVKELQRYYEGLVEEVDMEEDDDDEEAAEQLKKAKKQRKLERSSADAGDDAEAGSSLLTETVKPRDLAELPPLFTRLEERRAERLHYLGVSFGLTQSLHSFWSKLGFRALYLRQTTSDITGEHTCIMLKPLASEEVEDKKWLDPFVLDFRQRLTQLLSGAFREMEPSVALSLLQPRLNYGDAETQSAIEKGVVVTKADGSLLSPYDLKRLQAYCSNLVDHHMVLDLLPPLARAFFAGMLKTSQTAAQAAILLVMGLQQRELSAAEKSLNLPSNQVLALYSKSVKKMFQLLKSSKEAAIERALPQVAEASARAAALAPHAVSLDAELDEGATEWQALQQRKLAALQAANREDDLNAENLEQYAIRGGDDMFEKELKGAKPAAGLLQVPSQTKGNKTADAAPVLYQKGKGNKQGSKRKSSGDGGGKGKRRS